MVGSAISCSTIAFSTKHDVARIVRVTGYATSGCVHSSDQDTCGMCLRCGKAGGALSCRLYG